MSATWEATLRGKANQPGYPRCWGLDLSLQGAPNRSRLLEFRLEPARLPPRTTHLASDSHEYCAANAKIDLKLSVPH